MNEYILEQTTDMNLIEWLDYNKQLKKKTKRLYQMQTLDIDEVEEDIYGE